MNQIELQRASIDKMLRESANTPKKLEAYQAWVKRGKIIRMGLN